MSQSPLRGARDLPGTSGDVDYLLSPMAVRQGSQVMLGLSRKGLTHFALDESRLDLVAAKVAEVTLKNYPTLDIPYHSRWTHFQVGGVDRNAALEKKLEALTPKDRAKSLLDLVVMSVLVDAGAGDKWKYIEKDTGKEFSRSEGLAVASWHFFTSGACSSDPYNPHRIDAHALERLDERKMSQAFQVSLENPMQGFLGRMELLRNLGRALSSSSEYFPNGRLGDLLDVFQKYADGDNIRAARILRAIQDSLGAIWPGRVSVNGVNLGDVWNYSPMGAGLVALVPFHKLSQWLTYSVVAPLEKFGMKVSGFEELSGLAEYRNGGLFVDMGVLVPRDPTLFKTSFPVESEVVVEWRALTLGLLDLLAPRVRKLLNKTEAELPLGKILEGGTWWAGRELAKELRPGGGSPIRIVSDGTVF